MRSKRLVVGMFVLPLVAAACGDDGTGPGDTADEPRTIEIAALDDLAYDPGSIEIEVGETVRFVVTNAGELDHEFVVGDREMQEIAAGQAMEGDARQPRCDGFARTRARGDR